jgi:hypothetical protein
MSKINMLCLSMLLVSCSLCLGCRWQHSECQEFLDMPTQQQQSEFATYSLEKQLDVYLCAMKVHPPYSSLANDIAERGDSAVPLIIEKMKTVKSDMDQFNLIYLLEVMSGRGTLRGRKDVVAEISQVIDGMKFDIVRERSLESLKKIEINSGIKPFTYVR